MKHYFQLSLLLIALTSFAISPTFAQKYGHINSGNLLNEFPSVEQANKQLETYQKQLVAKGQDMVKQLEAKYMNYQKQVEGGGVTPVQQQKLEQELQQKQQEIGAYEQKVMADVQKKREDLLKPILNKVDKAIRDVGKENGYTFIFDVSAGGVLFAQDSDVVMGLVKAKLGI